MPYTIGSEIFSTKKAVRERASRVLQETPHGVLLEGLDLEFVAALFELHPRVAEKRGSGVAGFFVARGPMWSSPNLWVLRIDGSSDNFSIGECLGGARRRPPTATAVGTS